MVTEDYKGAYDSTVELVRKGHRLIGGVFKSDDIQGIRRFSGYIGALTEEEIGINDDCIIWFSTETKFSIEQMLTQSKMISECTAIICYNDEVAMQVLSYLEKVPGRVTALRSFDGIISGRQQDMDIKSLIHPKEKLGQLAANKLFNIINGGSEESCIMPWELSPNP